MVTIFIPWFGGTQTENKVTALSSSETDRSWN